MKPLLLGLCLSLPFGFSVSAAETLQIKYLPNSRERFQTEQKTEQVLTIAGQKVETKSSTFQVTEQAVGAAAEDGSFELTEKPVVLQSEVKLPGGLAINFDSANADKPAENPLLEPLVRVLRVVSQTSVTFVLDADRKAKEVKFPPTAAELIGPEYKSLFDAERRKKSFTQSTGYLPDGPATVGTKWERTIETDLGSGQLLTVVLEYELKDPIEKDGRRLQRIASRAKTVSYSMDPNSPSPLKVSQSDLKPTASEGEILFDAQRGLTESRKSRIRIEGTLTLVFNGNDLPGTLDLTITDSSTRQPPPPKE